MTAAACGVEVLAGPAEATVTGNIAVQLIHLGKIEDLWQARKVIRDSVPVTSYQPENPEEWDAHYQKYLKAIGK